MRFGIKTSVPRLDIPTSMTPTDGRFPNWPGLSAFPGF